MSLLIGKNAHVFRALQTTLRRAARNQRADIVILKSTPAEQPDDSAHSRVSVTPNTSGAAPSSQGGAGRHP